MPVTAMRSCRIPGSDPVLLAEDFAWPLAATGLPFASSQVAVCLLKNSDDDSRRLGTRFVRAIVFCRVQFLDRVRLGRIETILIVQFNQDNTAYENWKPVGQENDKRQCPACDVRRLAIANWTSWLHARQRCTSAGSSTVSLEPQWGHR
jgi:hypothetical protein